MTQIRKSPAKPVRRPSPLDLRTPGGRALPY
jgi:hypothetical protein